MRGRIGSATGAENGLLRDTDTRIGVGLLPRRFGGGMDGWRKWSAAAIARRGDSIRRARLIDRSAAVAASNLHRPRRHTRMPRPVARDARTGCGRVSLRWVRIRVAAFAAVGVRVATSGVRARVEAVGMRVAAFVTGGGVKRRDAKPFGSRNPRNPATNRQGPSPRPAGGRNPRKGTCHRASAAGGAHACDSRAATMHGGVCLNRFSTGLQLYWPACFPKVPLGKPPAALHRHTCRSCTTATPPGNAAPSRVPGPARSMISRTRVGSLCPRRGSRYD